MVNVASHHVWNDAGSDNRVAARAVTLLIDLVQRVSFWWWQFFPFVIPIDLLDVSWQFG